MSSQPSNTEPVIDRPDVEFAVVSSWQTRLAGLHVAAEALVAAWTAWPDGLLARTCLTGLDGQSLLEYTQWRDEASLLAARPVPAMLAGASLEWQTAYRPYRSYRAGASTRPGCIVIVRATFDAADPERRQRTIDAMMGDADAGSGTNPDLLGAHFHVGVDGKSVLNYAEWTSEAAHKAFMEAPAEGAPSRDEAASEATADPVVPEDVWAGLTGSSIRRYTLFRTQEAPNT